MLTLPTENDVIAGKYRVERVIGRGGMGVVVAAWHLELDQRVALKFLMPELAERGESAERFRREARAAARIKSEHVVRVLDVGNWEGNAPYMVMEYLDGRDLSAELRERGTLTTKECVDYLLQAIDALAEAHALGIVHRDLKPENLFLNRRPDGSRSVKVLDFGISKTIVLGSSEEQSLTRTTNIMGSPFYMSPEQMRTPRNVDARSDIWAIGAILYNLLAGRPPYVAETIPQLCTMLLENDPEPLRGVRNDVSEELERIVMRCLAKSTSDRWASVSELAVALAPFGSRSSRVHVERASRVLRAPGAAVSPESALASSEPPPPMAALVTGPAAGLGGATPTQASGVPIPSAPDSATQDSWGHTQRPQTAKPNGSKATRPNWQWFVLAGAVLLSAVVAVVSFRSGVGTQSDSAHDNAPGLVQGKEPNPPAPIVPSASPASAAVAPALQSATSEPAPVPSAALQAAPGPSVDSAADMAAKKQLAHSVPQPTLQSVPQRPKPSASSGLTDFGGRR
jgi:serine/threonine-protein kinase